MDGLSGRGLSLICAVALGCAVTEGPATRDDLRAAGLEPWTHADPYVELWYPESWLPLRPNAATQVLRAAGPTGLPLLNVNILPRPSELALQYANQALIPNLERRGTNVRVVAARTVRLGSGERARESTVAWQLSSGLDVVTVYLSAFTQEHWIIASVTHEGTGARTDVRQIVRGLALQPETRKDLP